MAKDVTMMRNAIKELTRIHKKLKHSLKELEHSQDELIHSEKLSFAGRIAATVAHEIRNPLNIISMAMQQLHNELRKKDPHREYTKMVLEHITRVNKLLTEFVNVTRPLKLRMRWDDINIVLEDVLKLMEPKFQERRVALIKNLDINLPEIKFDKDQMIEAFTNLLLNSCEALPKRGGRIWVNSKREGDFIEIKIRNSGKPILKKDLIRIFDPFFTTKTTGTGLGTSIAYNIIGSHRGTITVDSDRKIGTTFTIRMSLPEEREGDYAE